MAAKGLTLNPRLEKLPPYLFVELDRKKQAALARGVDIISLGIGDPDLPTPSFIVDRLTRACKDPANHRYPDGKGSPAFRRAVAAFMKKHYGVSLDPDREICALIGSKEGIGHLPLALAGPGETVLVPDPGYPPYFSGALFAGAKPVLFPLREKLGFVPELKALPKKAKLIFLNYPNNPTGATAPPGFLEDALAWARKAGAWVAHDAAYAEAFLDGRRPPSLLQFPGAMERGIEFHSLSKTFNMTGWRVGWACGNERAVSALAAVKNNVDSGVFTAIQEAAAEALDKGDAAAEAMRAEQGRRRRLCLARLRAAGWRAFDGGATFYVWCAAPKGWTSARCAGRILDEAGVVVTPGNGFGKAGEGYVRLALTVSEARLAEALDRIAKIRW